MTMIYIATPKGMRVSITAYIKAWRTVKANPSAEFPGWEWYPVTGADVYRDMTAGMHDRINKRGCLTVRTPASWDAWRRDQRAIEDYRLRRIIRRGSGLETAEGRRAAPDVHAAFRGED